MPALRLADTWKRSFGDALPAAFLLRQQLPDRWLRVHSLPDAKRYPECAEEYEEALERHNTVGSLVLGEGSRCSLFIARFGETRQWTEDGSVPLAGDIPVHVIESGDSEDPMQFFGLEVTWHRSAFDKLIRAVADDATGPVLFANAEAGTIYAPYDGGADLFLPSAAEAALAKSRFQCWLSSREDGL